MYPAPAKLVMFVNLVWPSGGPGGWGVAFLDLRVVFPVSYPELGEWSSMLKITPTIFPECNACFDVEFQFVLVVNCSRRHRQDAVSKGASPVQVLLKSQPSRYSPAPRMRVPTGPQARCKGCVEVAKLPETAGYIFSRKIVSKECRTS